MAGCKRCELKEKKKEREKKRKEKEKRRKRMGIKIVFFFVFVFFYKSVRMFFHMRSGHFSNIYGKLYLDLADHIRFCLPSKLLW